MKFLVEQIAPQEEEEVRVRCHDTEEKWVEAIRAVTAGEASVIGISDGKRYRLRISTMKRSKTKLIQELFGTENLS